MNCRRIRKMISPYIDDELSPGRRATVAMHLLGCEECRKEMEETRALHELFASAERSPAPYGFATRVAAQLQGQEAREGLWARLSAHAVVVRCIEVAFACAVLIIGIMSGSRLVSQEGPARGSADIRTTFSLDVFEPTPPDSIGGAYVRMMGVGDER